MTNIENLLLTSRISDYPIISQGKTRIPGVNDGDQFAETDVSFLWMRIKINLKKEIENNQCINSKTNIFLNYPM